MDVLDFDYVGDMIGAIEFAELDGRSASDNFIGNPDDICQISKVYVDGVNSEIGDEDLNGETNNGSIVAEARQVDLESESIAREGGLENLDMVVGHGTAVSHGEHTVEEEIFEQKEVVVKVQVDCSNIEPADLFVQLPNVGEKVNSVVNLDVFGQDEGKVMSDDDLRYNQGTGVIEGCTHWWDSLYIETATKASEEECRNGDFGEVCDDASTKLLENEDRIGLKPGVLIPKKRGRENQTEKEGEYFVSDLVWGKVRSHPWWPGQILAPSSASDNVMKYFKKDSYLIAYFGDQTFAWNDASKILPFGLYFQEMEKQRGEESLKLGVDAALEEVSRRVECGLACGCLPERVLDRVKGQVGGSSDGFPAAKTSFVPAELVDYLKSLAKNPKGAVSSRLQFTNVRAQLLAFIRWKGCIEFPLIENFTRSLENDTDLMALHEVELFDEVLEVVVPAFKEDDAVKGNSFTKNPSYKRKHPAAEVQRKNKRYANGEISVEKVREGHLLPTVNNEAAFSLPRKCVDVGKSRRVTGKLEKSSSFKSSCRSSQKAGKHRGQRPTSDEMLSKMVIVAQNPMETCSLLKSSVSSFFVNFRNSVCLENNSMEEPGIIGNNLEDHQVFLEHETRTENNTLIIIAEPETLDVMNLKKDGGIIQNNMEEEPGIFESEKATVFAEPLGLDDTNPNKDGDGDTNAMLLSSDADTSYEPLIAELQGLDDANANNDGDGEISVEKKVREGHLLPTLNHEAASASSLPRKRVGVGKLRRVTGKLEKSSSFKSSGKHRGLRPTSDEMLSKMVMVAQNPMETCSSLLKSSVSSFFVNFRNSICLENNSMEEPGIITGNNLEDQVFLEHENNTLVIAEPEALDVMNLEKDEGIIQNNMEEEPGIFESEKAAVIAEPQGLDVIAEPETLDAMNLEKDGGIIQNNMEEEPGIFESDKATVIAEPQQGLADTNPNKDGDCDTNAMVTTSEPHIAEPQGLDDTNPNKDGDCETSNALEVDTSNEAHIDEKSEEYSPTLLILNFDNLQSIPSIKKLNKIFNCYGPLNELDTEILSKSKRAKIVFKRRGDADTAFSSAGKYRTFGPSLISYRLKYLPKTYNTKRRSTKKNAKPAALLQT